MSKEKEVTLGAHSVNVTEALKDLKALAASHEAGHAGGIGGGQGKPPELTDGQIRAVTRKHFVAADADASFEEAVAAVKGAMKK